MCLNAVLSDIHGNVQALEAVLTQVDDLGCEHVFCLGDTVGYGASPNECLELLRDRGARCLMGNHDAAVAGMIKPVCFNPSARAGIEYTQEVLTPANFNYLRSFPEQIRVGDDVLMVHGAPDDRDRYIFGSWDAMKTAAELLINEGPGICFYGHTHQRSIVDAIDVHEFADGLVRGDANLRTVINPGSVGQPRDGNPDAAFVVWDTEQLEFQFFRARYDIAASQDLIVNAGLPEWLAVRLVAGM